MDTIESPPEEDTRDQIPDAFLNVILSFNQHFTGETDLERCSVSPKELGWLSSSISSDPETNLVMRVLKTKKDPRHFSEKFMFLINRGGKCITVVRTTSSKLSPSLSFLRGSSGSTGTSVPWFTDQVCSGCVFIGRDFWNVLHNRLHGSHWHSTPSNQWPLPRGQGGWSQ